MFFVDSLYMLKQNTEIHDQVVVQKTYVKKMKETNSVYIINNQNNLLNYYLLQVTNNNNNDKNNYYYSIINNEIL